MRIESTTQSSSPEEKEKRIDMHVKAILRAYQLKTGGIPPNDLEIDELLKILFVGVPKEILPEVETEVRKQIG